MVGRRYSQERSKLRHSQHVQHPSRLKAMEETRTVSNTTAPKRGMYLCNICTPNLFSTQENLGGREPPSLAGLFCLCVKEPAEPCSSNESRFTGTKAEAPVAQRGPAGKNSSISVGDSCNLSLKDITKMALPAPGCCWEFGSGGCIVDKHIRERA